MMMKIVWRGTALLVCLLVCSGVSTPGAQTSGQPSKAVGTDRLFQAFEFDGALIPTQWWEGRLLFTDGNPIDVTSVGVLGAVRPYRDLEIGGRVGFGSTDTPPGLPDGSGATDLDVWGKWLASGNSDLNISVGAEVTVPTGDDTAGLGTDSFNFAVFGALRHPLPQADLVAHVGLRFNEDGSILGVPLQGKTSGFAGVGVILPLQDRMSIVAEADLETERFDGGDSDFRLLGGMNWHVSQRGVFRAAVTVGLTDGAPDAQLGLGYAFLF